MMCHALSRKRGICIKQSHQLGSTSVYEIGGLKYHAGVGIVKDPLILLHNRCSRLGCCVLEQGTVPYSS